MIFLHVKDYKRLPCIVSSTSVNLAEWRATEQNKEGKIVENIRKVFFLFLVLNELEWDFCSSTPRYISLVLETHRGKNRRHRRYEIDLHATGNMDSKQHTQYQLVLQIYLYRNEKDKFFAIGLCSFNSV